MACFSLREMKWDRAYSLIIHQHSNQYTDHPKHRQSSVIINLNNLFSGTLKKQYNSSTIFLPYYSGKNFGFRGLLSFPRIH